MQQHLLPATRELSAATRLPLPPSTAIRTRTPFPCSHGAWDHDIPAARATASENYPRRSPRRREPCPTHPIPKPQELVMWDGGLILDPARRRRLRQLFPLVGRPGEAGRNLGRGGSGQRVGKWSCRWRWPGLWAAAGQGSDEDEWEMGGY